MRLKRILIGLTFFSPLCTHLGSLIYTPLHAQTLDFEASVYRAEAPLIDVDGWAVFRDPENLLAGTFRIQSEAGNKSLRCLTTRNGILYRDFPEVAGMVSLSWRWRGTGDGVHFCLGVVRKLNLASGFDPRALACIDPFGTLEAQGGTAARTSKETWVKQKWLYMRMVMDAEANTSTLYLADSASRSDERLAVATMPMNDVGALSRLVLVNTDGTSPLDLDDILWEPVANWTGAGSDSNWSNPANWRGKVVPDTATRAVFGGYSAKNCFLDKAAAVGSIEVAAGYKGTINLGASTLAVFGKADFTGGLYANLPGGQILLNGAGRQLLTGPSSLPGLPPIRHDGPGALALTGRSLSTTGFEHSRGVFDFNGFDLTVRGDMAIRNGTSGSLANLGGRSVTVTGSALFQGISPDSPLHMTGSTSVSKSWALAVGAKEGLIARFANIGNCRAFPTHGLALNGSDAGDNMGWTFVSPPEIQSSPRNRVVVEGDVMTFEISALSVLPPTYQWLKNGLEIPGAHTSAFTFVAEAADHGAGFHCRVTNSAGEARSTTAFLTVEPPLPMIPIVTVLPVEPSVPAIPVIPIIPVVPLPGIPIVPVEPHPQPSYPVPGASLVLAPGQSLSLSERYALIGPTAGTPISIQVLDPVGLNSIRGFAGIRFAVNVEPPQSGNTFTNFTFSAPLGEPGDLYHMDGMGRVRRVSDGNKPGLPGTYFLAMDTLSPRIELINETLLGESTQAVFAIRDNVFGLTVDLSRTDDPALGFKGRSLGDGESLTVVLTRAPGPLSPLALRLEVSDGKLRVSFPASPGTYHALARTITGTVRTPPLFHIGGNKTKDQDRSNPWDLIAFPIPIDPPLSLGRLRRDNPNAGLKAAMWDDGKSEYRFLSESEPLIPGSSVWIGSAAGRFDALEFVSLRTAPRLPDQPYRIPLRKGWNQVANPTFSTLYWPVTRRFPSEYAASPLLGLHRYDAATGGFVHSDSLEAWRGYFVFHKGEKDTVVQLRSSPLPVAASKSAQAESSRGITIRLSLDNVEVTLGAAVYGRDGIGPEDESRPPSFDNRAPRLTTVRSGRFLETDVMHWSPGSSFAWKVLAGPTAGRSTGEPGADASERARVRELSLPPGYTAWAVSRKRGLRFRLDQGNDISVATGFNDSLDIIAGPSADLESRLAAIPSSPGGFQASISTAPGGFSIALRLPAGARVQWSLWALDGRRVESGDRALPSGIYQLPGNGTGRGARGHASGPYILAMAWSMPGASRDGGGSGRLDRRIFIP